MTTERAIEVLQEQAQTLRNLQVLKQLSEEGLERLQALDKAIEVMGNRDVIDKLEVRLRSHERAEYHPLSYIRIDEVKDLIESFKKDLQ